MRLSSQSGPETHHFPFLSFQLQYRRLGPGRSWAHGRFGGGGGSSEGFGSGTDLRSPTPQVGILVGLLVVAHMFQTWTKGGLVCWTCGTNRTEGSELLTLGDGSSLVDGRKQSVTIIVAATTAAGCGAQVHGRRRRSGGRRWRTSTCGSSRSSCGGHLTLKTTPGYKRWLLAKR